MGRDSINDPAIFLPFTGIQIYKIIRLMINSTGELRAFWWLQHHFASVLCTERRFLGGKYKSYISSRIAEK
jgi:hypothetical protein